MKSKKIVFILIGSLTLFIILTFLVIVENIPVQNFNDTIYHHISQTIHPHLTSISILIGGLTHWYSYAPIILLLIILPKTRFKAGIPMAITLSVSALMGPILLKNLFAIERPMINPLVEVGGFGYPSGHSLNALVFFTALSILIIRYAQNKRLKISFVTFSIIAILLVGISRVYLGLHTVTDVLGGYLAGGAILCSMLLLEEYFINKRTCQHYKLSS
jgi:undecaprenyl-diphosphatase